MKVLEYIIKDLISKGVNRIVTHTDICIEDFCENVLFNNLLSVTKIIDERSLGYVAIGMYEEEEKPIVLIVKESSMRNLAPAITEAFYRKFPFIVLSLEDKCMNHIQYPQDMFDKIIAISSDNLENYIDGANIIDSSISVMSGLPILVSISDYDSNIDVLQIHSEEESFTNNIPKSCGIINKIMGIISAFDAFNTVFYIDSKIICLELLNQRIKGRIEYSNGLVLREGLVSMMFGASVVAPNKLFIYIGKTSSAIYDLNTLGNRHIKNNVCMCLLDDDKSLKTIIRVCKTWGYDIYNTASQLDNIVDWISKKSSVNPSIIEIS